MAGEVAVACGAGELILFHHDPAYSDELVAAQEEYLLALRTRLLDLAARAMAAELAVAAAAVAAYHIFN